VLKVLFTRKGLTARRRFFIAVNSRPPFTIRTSLLTLNVDVRLLSSESYECSISVMALTAGRLPFPRLQLRSSAFDSLLLDEIVCVSMPAALFVLPQAKE
uniref:TGF-beta family profile domain-containing protein n=2 Tax=Parascaris univalens TaxID=6257 RepID=A0A915A0A5_PARUN